MLINMQGDIFLSKAIVLVNPVNTEGIMGKGLAYQFKQKFPNNFKNYSLECKEGNVDIDKPLVWTKEKNKIIVNFPTKKSWKENSKIEYIEKGLEKLKQFLIELKLESVAIPPIGAGNGKLDWDLVAYQIKKFSESLPNNIEIFVYTPTSDVAKLSRGHYFIAYTLLNMYEKGISKDEINDITFQKIIFMGDKSNYFKFSKEKKGPFSKLLTLQYNELKDYSKIRKFTLKKLKEDITKLNISKNLEREEINFSNSVDLYLKMKKFYSYKKQSDFDNEIELLGTISYIVKNSEKEKFTTEDIYNEVINWNERKKKIFTRDSIEKMLEFMLLAGEINKNILNEYCLKQ